MKTFILIILCILHTINIFSQTEYYYSENNDSTTYFFEINTETSFGSNCINYTLLKSFLYKLPISNHFADQSIYSTKRNNVAGGIFQTEITFLHKKIKNTSWGLGLSLGYSSIFATKFSKDALLLFLKGNSIFEDQTANISNTVFKTLTYQYLKATVLKTLNKNFTIAFLCGLYKAQDFSEISIQKGYLYTAPYGEFIDLSLEYNINISDTTKKGLKAINGFGIGTDFFIEYNKNNHKILFKISDIGFLKWNDKTMTLKKDTNLSFYGVKINNILKADSSTFYYLRDSLIKSFTNSYNKKITTYIPTMINLTTEHSYNKHIFTTQFNYHFFPGYYPFVSFGYGYRVFSSVLKLCFSWGGWGSFNTGFELNLKSYNNKHNFYFRTFAMNGWIIMEKAKSLDLAIKYQLKL